MPEWWTYTLEDLQSFRLDTYYRLFERHNAAIWPAQIAALALGAAILVLLSRGEDSRRSRIVAAILAAGWLSVALAFHLARYATIHRAAPYFAAAFGIEALLLAGVAVLGAKSKLARRGGARRIGLALFLYALVVHPLVGMLFGREWRQVEIFGVAPDPTAVGTLGVVLLAAGRARWALLAVPALWCLFSGATLLAMGTPAGWLMVGSAVVAVGSGLNSGRA